MMYREIRKYSCFLFKFNFHDQRTPMISNIVGARLNLYMFIICFLVIKFHKLFPLKCVQFVVFEGPFLYMISVLYIIPVPKLYE